MEGLGFLDETLARQLTENVRAIFLETGTFAKRPSPGRRKGHVWFAWDTQGLYIWDGSTWLLVATGSDSFTVKVSADDTTNKFLEDAIVAGSGIAVSTLTPGANETVEVAANLADGDIPAGIARDSEVTADIATHAAIASAHHSRYTDAEVDAIVATHTAIPAAHHALVTLHAGLNSNLLALSTQELDLDTQTANKLFAGPSAGGAAKPTFRDLVAADLSLAILKTLLTTRGDMIRRSATVPERFAKGTSGKFLKAGANDPDWQWDEASIPYVIDGGGSVIKTGLAGGFPIEFDCFIIGWTIGAIDGNTGAIVVDVWKDTYANFPPTVADTIAGTEKPTITATGNKGQDLSLSSWTQAVTKGDWLFFNVDSVATLERVAISLRVQKYRTS